MDTLIDEMTRYEELGFKVTAVFVTHEQYADIRKWDMADLSYQEKTLTIFGAELKVHNTPAWCVGIYEEQDERYFYMYRDLQQFVLQQAGGVADTKNDPVG